ncbi:Gnk2-homologous domain [Arabidopsis thaliana x Arabidopsis arenosa]|uniref:Gnk2-homologous domain n=1 Tax=Arabidopsis thaliana x Arabidopsis arenosa TaxID=1240361 RepID=A0A8T2AZL8_9BRAS|nr:Gnk2-homologous domain [Arabidopsis thaliana x Arabidopsis arenosa]
MSSTFGSVPILTVVAIQLFLIRNVLSLNVTNEYLHHKCNKTQGIYKRGSAFEKNLNIALRTVIFNGDFRTGFRYGDVGEDPNTVFVMYQCRGDSYWSNCRTCVTTALSGLRKRCPGNKGAIICGGEENWDEEGVRNGAVYERLSVYNLLIVFGMDFQNVFRVL